MKFMLLNERQDVQGSCASSFAGSLDVYLPSTGFATAHFGDILVSLYSHELRNEIDIDQR